VQPFDLLRLPTWWQVFLYMDRSYVVATPGVRSLFDMGLQLFRTHLARHREVRHHCSVVNVRFCQASASWTAACRHYFNAYGQVGAKTTQGLLQLIRAERNGDTVNRLLLAHLLRMLTALGIYQSAFQVCHR
jgi:cullin 4